MSKRKVLSKAMLVSMLLAILMLMYSVPTRAKADESTEKFITEIGETCRKLAGENDLYASVMIAQAILESGSGTSKLAVPGNYNLFGMKGAYNGNSITVSTKECDSDGNYYSTKASFRKYPSYKESLEDYKNNLNRDIYAGVWKSNTSSYKDATKYLQGLYATSNTYTRDLNEIIEYYNLTDYDDYKEENNIALIKEQMINAYESARRKVAEIEKSAKFLNSSTHTENKTVATQTTFASKALEENYVIVLDPSSLEGRKKSLREMLTKYEGENFIMLSYVVEQGVNENGTLALLSVDFYYDPSDNSPIAA